MQQGVVCVRSRIYDMRRKEVINVRDGSRLGNVGDIEFDTVTASIISMIIYGRLRFFGLLGREDDRVIPWADIRIIGDDIVLVDTPIVIPPHSRRKTTAEVEKPVEFPAQKAAPKQE
jgi:YlmC/YmxH family sporulation protein